MKKYIAVLTAVVALALPAVASATPGGGYGSQPGYEKAVEVGAQCGTGAGSGAFGAFGTNGNVTHDYGVNHPGSNGVPGADGPQTGLNNSQVCKA